MVAARVAALAWLASNEPELVVEALSREPSAGSYAFIRQIGQLVPPQAVELLGLIGLRHPDKAVAKTARKQLFRTRSRLAQQRAGGASS